MAAAVTRRATEAPLHRGRQRRERHADHDPHRDPRDHVRCDRHDGPDRGREAGRTGEHHHRGRVHVDELGGRRRACRHPPRADELTLGTVRRDGQPDGDRGASAGAAHPGAPRSRSSRTIVGLVVAQRIFVAAHRPLSWAAACRRRRRDARPGRRPPRGPHPTGARGAAHLRRPGRGRRGHHLPRVRRGRAGPRPAGDRRARTPPRPSRTARTASASWRATSTSPIASPTAWPPWRTASRAAVTCSARRLARPPPTSCAPSSPSSS